MFPNKPSKQDGLECYFLCHQSGCSAVVFTTAVSATQRHQVWLIQSKDGFLGSFAQLTPNLEPPFGNILASDEGHYYMKAAPNHNIFLY